jgi:drug/metabolite transporter (DMT)-like permease
MGTTVLLLLQIGVVSTALGFLLWIAVLRWLPAGTASLNMFAIPVIALLSSMAVFGERLTRNEWIGIGCIGAGLALISLDAWRQGRRGVPMVTDPTPLEGG